MKIFWSRAAMVFVLIIGLTAACLAQFQGAPEIDANSGAAGLTLVVGAMLWLQQRRRRR